MSNIKNMPHPGIAAVVARFYGIIVGLITVSVMWGWFTHGLAFTKIFPSFAPMQFNTAIGLFACSVALILRNRSRYLGAALCMVPLLIGGLTLFEYVADATVGIDTLFIHPFTDVNVSTIGRMAPNTATALLLLSCTLLIYNLAQDLKYRAGLIVLLIAGIVVALGIVPVFSSIVGIEAAHAWGSSNRVALHTAFCFIVLAIGIILQVCSGNKKILSWLPLPVCVSLLVITGLLSTAIRSEENKNFDNAVQLEAGHIAKRMELQLHDLYQALDRIANRWDSSNGTPQDLWESDARAYLVGFPFLSALSHADKDTRIQWLASQVDNNRQAIGFKLDSEPLRAEAIHKAIATHTSQVTRALKLLTGDKGFLYVSPLYANGHADGFQIAVFQTGTLFKIASLEGEAQRVYISISQDHDLLYSNFTGDASLLPWLKTATIQNLDSKWTLQVIPTPEFLASRNFLLSWLVLGSGLAMSFLITLSVILALRWRENALILRESETLKKAILDSSGYMIIATDPKGTVTTFNKAAEQALGYTAEEVIGKQTPAIWHDVQEITQRANELSAQFKKDIQPGFEVFTEIPNLEGAEEREWTYIAKNSRRYPVSLTATVLYGEDKTVTGYVGIIKDISKEKEVAAERRLAEEKLRYSEEVFRLAMENASIGMALVSPAGKWLSVNTALCNLLGYDRESLLKTDFQTITHPDDLILDMENVQKVLSEKIQTYSMEKRYFHKDGRIIWTLLNVALARDQNGTPNYFIKQIQDITERKEMDRMKGEFISVVSHELRTPLTSIRGSLGLIAGALSKDLPEKVRHLVDIAHKNSERLILLINDILDIDKIAAGQMRFDMKHESLNALVQQAVETNRPYAEKLSIQIIVEDISSGIAINVDHARFMQVLSNLLSNAAKFSPKDGTVRIFGASSGKKIRVCVADNGPGIAEEFRPRIFGKFSQADSSATREKGGTGLGLHITKEIVEHMGGKIGFDTELGKGTVFWVEFSDVSQPVIPVQAELAHSGREAYRVLICEDDQDIVAILKMQMEQAGFTSDVAYSIADARAKLQNNTYAAMTLDLAFPAENGLEFIHELRAELRTLHLPIVVISAKAEEGRRTLNGDAFGVIDWLQKPLDEKQLASALLRATSAKEAMPYILHVEDDQDISEMLSAALQSKAKLVNVSTIHEAKERLARENFSLVILDMGLPDGNGLGLLPYITDRATAPIPVLILSAHEVSLDVQKNVVAAMVKSRMSETKIVETILSLIPVHLGSSSPDGSPTLLV